MDGWIHQTDSRELNTRVSATRTHLLWCNIDLIDTISMKIKINHRNISIQNDLNVIYTNLLL